MVFGFFKKKKKEQALEQSAEISTEVATSVEAVVVEALHDGTEVVQVVKPKEVDTLIEASVTEAAAATISGAVDVAHASADLNSDALADGFAASNGTDVDFSSNRELHQQVSSAIAEIQDELQPLGKLSWAERLKLGLSKTRNVLGKKLLGVFGGGKIDDELYEELESILLTSDVGVSATNHLLEEVRTKVSLRGLKDSSELKLALTDSMVELIKPLEDPLLTDTHTPFVIMMVGVNGAGKTTSIGKLAHYFQQQGKSVILAAGDTFRAAAREQLIEWGKRNGVAVVSQQSGDSAAVCFDAIQSAVAKKIDIVLADTAGRLPTQLNLMEEIKKVKRVISKALPNAPHEIMLVLDANIGQNAISQVKAFDDALGLTGLVLTKLDGTAKGGVICAIAKERAVALRFIGVGEAIDDLRPFKARDYVDALLG